MQTTETETKENKYLTAQQASEYLTNERGLITSIHTLRRLIVTGEGPDSYTYGPRKRLYSLADLNKWADSRLVKHNALGA